VGNKILIIEDRHKELTDRIANWLTQQGDKVETVTNVREVYSRIDEFQPELIIRNCQRSGGLATENS